MRNLQVGQPVIVRRSKATACPGPRAQNVEPAQNGEMYTYEVDKFWLVDEVLSDGSVRLRTRRGKTHVLDKTDERLRRPSLWERIRYRRKFPDAVGQ